MGMMTNLLESILSIINNAILIVGSDDPITFTNHKAATILMYNYAQFKP